MIRRLFLSRFRQTVSGKLLKKLNVWSSVQQYRVQMNEKTWKYPNISAGPNHKLRKPEFKERPSLLDETHPQSRLNTSHFRGFFNLVMMFGLFFLFTKPILNFINTKKFLSTGLFDTFKDDFLLCLCVWPLFYIWSYTSLIIQKLIILGLSPKLAVLLQHSSQTGLFIFTTYLILSRKWCATHASFVILQAAVHFMKMHSFSTTNRDYRLQSAQAKALDQKPLSTYPHNVNLYNFTLYMWMPTLVYDESYPRKKTRDIQYILKKSAITILSILASYIIYTDYVIVWIELGARISFFELLLRCLMPFLILELLLFYIVFESITNIFGELTKFADRQFYEDWWNSTTFEEFNRLWNKPVHCFLYRHIYLEAIQRYGTSKSFAQLLTFGFSACLHEFLFAVIFRTIRPIFLGFIVGQIPLFYLTRWMRGTPQGNYLLWFGLLLGPSLIVSCYLRVDESVTNLFTVPMVLPPP